MQSPRQSPATQPSVAPASPSTLPATPVTVDPAPQRVDKPPRIKPADDGVALPRDVITVVLPVESADLLDPKARSGRMILFFKATESRVQGDPSDGPFFDDPQPICSADVAKLTPGAPTSIDDLAVWWPGGSELFDGEYQVQAIFDSSNVERGHLAAGNLISKVTTVDFQRDRSDVVVLDLTEKIPAPTLSELDNLEWIDISSPSLSAMANRPITHRAGVVFPRGYHDLKAKRRVWPTIYVIPGFGGRWTDATELARITSLAGLTALWPQAVYVILDPESALGHHGFVDSVANGPRGAALVSELVPYLEDRFRLIRDPSARIVTGHSSGGWTSVWLALNYPLVFGAAFASSPDPLDFSAFQTSDLYKDESLFVGDDGSDRPSFRLPVGPSHELVPMLVREEIGMEQAISPQGTSGEQWDAWAAMFSPIAEGSSTPRRLCDPRTGSIDPVTVESWSHFDIARRIRRDWDGWGKLFVERVRVIVGERDSFYLERAAIRLRDSIDEHARELAIAGMEYPAGPGYIAIVAKASHDSVFPIAQLRFNDEMRAWLKRSGNHE